MDPSSHMPSPEVEVSLETVAAAWQALRPALWCTPLVRCPALEELCGCRVWLKAENLQRTGSYKLRGAYYKLHRLVQTGRTRRVVAASAGNHSQGVAYAARELGLDCVIVMPETAPLPKRQATQHYGAKLLFHGSCFDDSLAFALEYARTEQREFLSPFNDLDIIIGQATLAWEVLEDLRDQPPDGVLVPVGGGGLLAGVASVVKQRLPRTRIIAVQSASAPAFERSWKAYRTGSAEPMPLDVPTKDTIADGVRVRRPGDLCWQLTRDLVDSAVCLDDSALFEAIVLLMEHSKLVVEGAGALGVAALLDREAHRQIMEAGLPPNARLVSLLTGGNIDSLTVKHVVERSLTAKGRLRAVAVRIGSEPGQLAGILDFLHRKRARVMEVRRSSRVQAEDAADIEILIEVDDRQHGREVLEGLDREAKAHHFELLPPPAHGGRPIL
jgi:threonine dehydratase